MSCTGPGWRCSSSRSTAPPASISIGRSTGSACGFSPGPTWAPSRSTAYPLLLNRLLYLSLVPLLIVLAVRWHGRRHLDAVGIRGRLRPGPLLRNGLQLTALAAPAGPCWPRCWSSAAGPATRDRARRSGKSGTGAATSRPGNGFRMPSVSRVDLDLDIEPAARTVQVDGAYTFLNHRDYAYDRFPVTAGPWEPIEWTLGGGRYEPENRDGLYIFRPADPLEPGDTVTVGFRYRAEVFGGISKAARPLVKYVLESGVNLDGFNPSLRARAGIPVRYRFGAPRSSGVPGRLPRRPDRGTGRAVRVDRPSLHGADAHHDPGGVHRERRRAAGERGGGRRQTHGGVGDGPPPSSCST